METENITPENNLPPQEDTEVKTAGLEKTLADKEAEIVSLRGDLEEAKKVIVETSLDLSGAVAAYRELAVQVNPGPVAEMIAGSTIAEINASLKNARELVAKVRRETEAENAVIKVPAGAPQRTSPDFSGLSAREKIRYGIGG